MKVLSRLGENTVTSVWVENSGKISGIREVRATVVDEASVKSQKL